MVPARVTPNAVAHLAWFLPLISRRGFYMVIRRFLTGAVCLIVSLLLPNIGLACTNLRGPNLADVVPFLEPSYMSAPTGFHNHQWFEADVAMHFNVFSNFTQELDPSCPNNNWAVLFTPGILVRMLQARSNPVRTPSYMPRLDVQEL